ncbi:MAG: asparagine synthase (glutamine-hydrolyzing) [Lentisphaeria bacterium]|jgi:asparagine synthase (glutamine-hydrolysing)
MSAIHACWELQPTNIQDILNKMLQASDYWQPDALTSWCSPNDSVGFGKAHLFNTARSHDDNVSHDVHCQLTVVANARIDNREQLASEFLLSSDDPLIATDGLLILHAYIKWGNQCAAHLRGDFVFIIWDEEQKKFFCGRDHFGVKVLFYAKTARGIMFSNEHRAFFDSGWCNKQDLSEAWLIKNLWGLGSKTFDSPCNDIHVVPPAHTIEISDKGVKLRCYWRLEAKDTWADYSDEALIEELRQRFDNAVVARLDSQYPIGSELSEGLDSNGVTGFAARYLNPAPLFTFSCNCIPLNKQNTPVWGDTYKDIAQMFDVHENLQSTWLDQTDDEECFLQQQKTAYFEGFGAVLPVRSHHFFYRARCAQSHGVRVLLSGWGGDHCVTSYGDHYADELLAERKFTVLFRHLKAKYQRGRGARPTKAFLSQLYKAHLAPSLSKFHIRRGAVEAAVERRARHHFLGKQWRRKFNLESALDQFIKNYSCHIVKDKELLELFDLGLTNRLIESELLGRVARLEYRHPMLDVDLVTFAHSLPSRLKIYQGIERYPFRRVLEGVTTKSIQWRKKSEVIFPKLDHEGQLIRQSRSLARRLRKSIFAERYSCSSALDRSLEFLDPFLFSRLEFLLDMESYHRVAFDKQNS